jgi:pyridoxine kinase
VTGDAEASLARTASAVYGLVEATWRAGSRELLLVEAQRAIVEPPHLFRPTRLR